MMIIRQIYRCQVANLPAHIRTPTVRPRLSHTPTYPHAGIHRYIYISLTATATSTSTSTSTSHQSVPHSRSHNQRLKHTHSRSRVPTNSPIHIPINLATYITPISSSSSSSSPSSNKNSKYVLPFPLPKLRVRERFRHDRHEYTNPSTTPAHLLYQHTRRTRGNNTANDMTENRDQNRNDNDNENADVNVSDVTEWSESHIWQYRKHYWRKYRLHQIYGVWQNRMRGHRIYKELQQQNQHQAENNNMNVNLSDSDRRYLGRYLHTRSNLLHQYRYFLRCAKRAHRSLDPVVAWYIEWRAKSEYRRYKDLDVDVDPNITMNADMGVHLDANADTGSGAATGRHATTDGGDTLKNSHTDKDPHISHVKHRRRHLPARLRLRLHVGHPHGDRSSPSTANVNLHKLYELHRKANRYANKLQRALHPSTLHVNDLSDIILEAYGYKGEQKHWIHGLRLDYIYRRDSVTHSKLSFFPPILQQRIIHTDDQVFKDELYAYVNGGCLPLHRRVAYECILGPYSTQLSSDDIVKEKSTIKEEFMGIVMSGNANGKKAKCDISSINVVT